MGYADNMTYKDTYYFKKNPFRSDPKNLQSLNVDTEINTVIKENEERANVEIEKDEIVLKPDLTALFKARGKKHSGGGIDVYLKPNSFIFSDDKSLALTENDHELFELKEGGNFKGAKNTPAKVLRRNIDLEHYNRLVTNISDPYKDDLAKKSSAMMLEKYIDTLGRIAYVQESKKDFPTGIPDFSIGSAPVYDSSLKTEIDEQKQYAKYGGNVLPKAQMGLFFASRAMGSSRGQQPTSEEVQMMENLVTGAGKIPISSPPPKGNPYKNWGVWPGDKLPIFSNRYGVSNAADKITDLDFIAKQLGYTGPKSNKDFQQWLYNSSPENKAIIDKWHQTYNVGPSEGMFDNKIGIRWQNAINEIINPRTTSLPTPELSTPPYTPSLTATPRNIVNPGITPGSVTGDPQGAKSADWQFTPWQKISQLYNLGKYATAQRYMPMRSRFNPSYVDPQLVNPEQTVGDLRAAANQQINSLNTLNPVLRNAQAASSFGQLLNQLPGVRSQYDNQNAGIVNQFRQYNNQVANNARAVNMQNDQNYYMQSVEARKNFDNLRSFLGDQYMNNLMRDVETNQTLAYNELTLNNPAYSYDFRTGNFRRNAKDIRDVAHDNRSDVVSGLMNQIDFNAMDTNQQLKYLEILTKKDALKYLRPQKKGGRVNPYKN